MKAKSAIAPKPRRSAAKRKPQIRKPETREAQTRHHKCAANARSRGAATRTRLSILDAAERSFAESGFDGVSLRAITERAGVDLALANYHFGSKENLLHEVIARRARVVHDERVKALELARQQAGTQSPSIEAIVVSVSGADVARAWPTATPAGGIMRASISQLDVLPKFTALASGVLDPTALHFINALRLAHAESAGTVGLLGLHVPARHHGAGDFGDRAHRAIVARALPLRRCRGGLARNRALSSDCGPWSMSQPFSGEIIGTGIRETGMTDSERSRCTE